jgi:predicted branched-subunit amino acid permease
MTVTVDLCQGVADGCAETIERASTRSSPFTAAREGARDIMPMILGVIPFALAIGTAIGTSSLSAAQGIVTGPAILAGAAQLSTISMLDEGAAPLVVVVSALMINARLMLYSASLAPWFATESRRRRMLLAVPVIDQLHFTCVPRFERGDLDARGRRWYYVGAAASLAGAWTITQVVAIVGGAQLPDWLGLRIAAPLALAGLLGKAAQGRRAVVAAVVAAVVTLLAAGFPYHSAVLVATVTALAVGTVTPRRVEEVAS